MLDRTSFAAPLRLALCALVLTAGGCSFVFVDGPPKKHAQLPYFECSSSNAWPVVDAVMAASLGLAASAAFADGGSSSNDTSQGLVAAAEAAAFAISAFSGFQKVTECREAKEELIASLGSRTRYAAPPASLRAPPSDPWVNPPPGLFAPRVTAPPPAPAPGPEDADEPDATATETPDSAPARPLPSIPAPAVDPETPR